MTDLNNFVSSSSTLVLCSNSPVTAHLIGTVQNLTDSADRQSGMLLPIPNLSKLKQLVRLKVMLLIIFFLTDTVFPVISLFEKIDYC